MTEVTTHKTNPVLKARNTVINILIDRHESEYHDLMTEQCNRLGVAYTRPLSAEDRARNDIAALLTKFPGLASEFGSAA